VDTKQIDAALARLFNEEGHRIVFWNDPEREFINTLPFVYLENVNVLRLDQVGALEAKIRLEREDPAGRYLVYSPTEEPDYEKDWLLDIRLYSGSFRADRASMLLQELGLVNQHLREHLGERRKFLDNKDRVRKLQTLVEPNDTDMDLDRKMVAVVARADQPEWFNIVRTLFHAYTESQQNGDIDLDASPAVWEQIEKFDLDKPFWQTAKSLFGYAEEIPCLRNLLIRLMVTDYAQHFRGDVPASLQHLVLPQAGRANAVVCLAQWRDSSSKGASYDRLSAAVARLLKMEDHLAGQEIGGLLDVMTFLDVEKAIVRGLRDRVVTTAATIDAEDVREIATRRQAGHWAAPGAPASPEVPRAAIHAVYDALVAAAEFFALRNRHQLGFDFDDAQAMYRAYETDLFRFDQLYRHFCEAADQAEAQNWDVLKKLRQEVEAGYATWYVTTLALGWGKFVDPQGRTALLAKWQIAQVPNQQCFFERYVRPRLEEADRRRAFVVVSDAFRYEAAEELTRELNGKYRFEAELSSQLGVLPSYTALGMAALLPHATLTYKASGDVLADDKPTAAGQRGGILAAVDGVAVKADDLLAMKKDEGREFVSGKRVVYIYHNAIDAVGDAAATEKDTFAAVRKAINDLAAIVGYVFNNLNGNHVVITADHGFLFTETPPGEPDRSSLPHEPAGTVKVKKRYLLGTKLPDGEGVWHGSTANTANALGDMDFWIPRGANRFRFTGASRFVHGGAMLQEVVVPVITVRHRKGKAAEETKTKPVTVHVLGTSHKITTARHRFELIQMEPVSERVKAITLKVAVYEGEEPVTNIETATFDSSSGNLDERRKWVHLVLQERQYDKKTPYRLVLRDADTGIEQQSVQVTIDRAFTDDF